MNVIPNLKKFMLGGNAVFTVVSKKTGNRITLRVKAPDEPRAGGPTHFVSALTGPDNETNYSYLGFLRDGRYVHGVKSKIGQDAMSAKAARWVCERTLAGQPLADTEVYHEGKCARCGRRLTVPSSIESGFGPECINYV
jgi:uncharacterized protein DUF6011